ncbi:MAG: hypothetical protein KGJ23_03455 [Euryarchaeota archaeon]|nr:hypothetical protein [Euryarchaeota archaeon]MDE1835656.1 hypothetical protein [Euryarchaeota archaeon]MDE1879004.1 hypothetical protein [Euryarchaeota archaeon]MDE2043722.1 hypothetical protein [Thermoplasmata archaeon]
MGRTVPTYRDALEDRLARWDREFGRALTDPKDRESFQELLQGARRYVAQGTMLSSGDLTERVFLSMLLDLERRLQLLQGKGASTDSLLVELASRAL